LSIVHSNFLFLLWSEYPENRRPEELVAHFSSLLAFETDASDVHSAIEASAKFGLVDVRGQSAWDQGRGVGAIYMHHSGITKRAPNEIPREFTAVFLCRSRNTSSRHPVSRHSRVGAETQTVQTGSARVHNATALAVPPRRARSANAQANPRTTSAEAATRSRPGRFARRVASASRRVVKSGYKVGLWGRAAPLRSKSQRFRVANNFSNGGAHMSARKMNKD